MSDESEVYLGLGSNLTQPQYQIRLAFKMLQQLPESRDAHCSPLYRSPPMGPSDQPDYINAVVRLFTRLHPEQLLAETQAMECRQGRVRGRRWGPRTLDIDLLLYGTQVIDQPDLKIPHPGIRHRLFVLLPLLDLAPQLSIPGQGPASRLAAELGDGIIERLP